MPGIRVDKSRGEVFPLQVCKVLPLQRVSLNKMTDFSPNVIQDLLKVYLNNLHIKIIAYVQANSPHPDDRFTSIRNQLREIGTGDCEAFMFPFGVRLLGGENEVEIKLRHAPQIQFGNKKAAVRNVCIIVHSILSSINPRVNSKNLDVTTFIQATERSSLGLWRIKFRLKKPSMLFALFLTC
jgi:hypothetical protein